MRYLQFSDRFTQLFDDPIEIKFPQTTVLLLQQEGLYESCGYSLWGECTLVVREPPAGPEKLSFSSPEGTFPKNLFDSGVMKNLSSPRDFAQGIESRQQMHSWIACYLRVGGKLLRSNFFLEIDVISSFF